MPYDTVLILAYWVKSYFLEIENTTPKIKTTTANKKFEAETTVDIEHKITDSTERDFPSTTKITNRKENKSITSEILTETTPSSTESKSNQINKNSIVLLSAYFFHHFVIKRRNYIVSNNNI